MQDKLLEWYLGLQNRTLDLVGDYAGNELFLLEGDSLLLECFGDLRIDVEDGFQLLHVVYEVERFLEALVRRLCNFHLIFFNNNANLCVPPHNYRSRNLYLLARSVIIRHFTCHLPQSHPGIEIHNFSSIYDPAFEDYLQSSGVYFVMCHDGAHSSVRPAEEDSEMVQKATHEQKVALRKMIQRFIFSGFNVALINGLEVRDTKVMAMIVEGKREKNALARNKQHDVVVPALKTEPIVKGRSSLQLEGQSDCLATFLGTLPSRVAAHDVWGSPRNDSSQGVNLPTERLSLVAFTLSQMLEERPAHAYLASAFLLHAIILRHIPLSARRLREAALDGENGAQDYRNFLDEFSITARAALESSQWRKSFDSSGVPCDAVDLIDGRLLKTVLLAIQGQPHAIALLPEDIQQEFNSVATVINAQSGIHLRLSEEHLLTGKFLRPAREPKVIPSILRFSNEIFDKHLTSISIEIDVQDADETDSRSAKIFTEITHWHNSKRPIDRMEATKIHNDKKGQRLLRSNQRHMDEMLKYAASLTNAAGKILNPQTITVQNDIKPSSTKINVNTKKLEAALDTHKSKPGKKQPVSKGKELAQASINSKKEVYAEKAMTAWTTIRETLDKVADPETRYWRSRAYLNDLPADRLVILHAEITLYSLQPLLEIWSGYCKADRKEDGYKIAALIWDQIKSLWKAETILTKTIVKHAWEVCRLLGFPIDTDVPHTNVDLPLTFAFKIPTERSFTLSVGLSPHVFQLLHCGPYLDRNMDTRSDARVPFSPDGWQRRVLDELDANHSVFVVAPTSAGKTFISFYAMEKVLRADDDGVLVYVAPTKALVNQIGAEVQARFSKTYKHGGKSVWAIHTRDYRVNNPTGCQVLVTVPHILQIMLLAPSNAKSWAPRVKRIIFDEIHSIGQAEDGVIWEQLLLLAPCPIIALSATVGNPTKFNDWLEVTQRSSGCELTMIEHRHRYSDLRKFVYNPPKAFMFGGLGKRSNLGDVGLDGMSRFSHFHPIASLVNKSRGIPADLALEARDCLILWQKMVESQTPTYPVPDELNPKACCPQIIAKVDVIKWEQVLKTFLSSWMLDSNSPFNKVLEDLSAPLETPPLNEVQTSPAKCTEGATEVIQPDDLCQTALPLVTDLHERNALPAILFNYDRSACERIAEAMLNNLERAETLWKTTSPKWKSLIEGYENWQATKNRKPARVVNSKKGKDKDGDHVSKHDIERESAEREGSLYEHFDPNAPREEFSFANLQKVEKAEMEGYFRKLEWQRIAEWLMRALTRGIGIHHAGMNRKYRQTVEILFRKGYLRVVIATGTLALGINMPCKTVVFSGDSVFLTALNFRQGAGRAGRRGFDILGNVVYHGISLDKACRLLSSRLPDLNGHFPMTTTLVLRLFTLLHESKNSTYAKRAVNSLLSQPRLYLGGESFKDQVLHHLRFSIEYLRRQGLLDPQGKPINFTSCVSHLYFTENSSFAFHALLKAGYFHGLCADIQFKPQVTLRQLMLVIAHLFGRRPCRLSDKEFIEQIVKRSASIVFLPDLPKKATKILKQHNQETLETFTTYVKTFAKQHVGGEDRTLPLTGLQVGGSQSIAIDALQSLPATTARSHFVALSGHSDAFTSIADLCSSTRSGIFLEKAVIPHLDIPSPNPLNAYLYDFFMHGAVQPLEIANGIRRGDVWFLLNDFSLVLATIVTSLENFLKVAPMEDDEMASLAGQGDVMEEGVVVEEESDAPSSKSSKPVRAKSPEPVRKNLGKKKVVPDSWDGSDGDDQEDAIAGNAGAASKFDTHDSYMDHDDYNNASDSSSASEEGLMDVLKAFQMLKAEFDKKFLAMWA